jgi:hypothetical protein
MTTQTNYITGLQLIESMPSSLHQAFITNVIQDRGHSAFVDYLSFEFSSPKQAYVCAFKFKDTIEGFEFWEEVYKP